ncbi:hypothetical protein CYMTET_17344 [Cymbomonas tetramitiformis]|uniref:Uncharacterized protein n=1 Tax=Cymbomonas tetramitiformis TaxID=36881 RepID=A0AAE0L722_9CHLO|nr:hypothetical protein CYMTET_17344 [Cymbomonas tetramitiformis]
MRVLRAGKRLLTITFCIVELASLKAEVSHLLQQNGLSQSRSPQQLHRATDSARHRHILQTSECTGCYSDTSGPCKNDNNVCQAYSSGTTCPTATTACNSGLTGDAQTSPSTSHSHAGCPSREFSEDALELHLRADMLSVSADNSKLESWTDCSSNQYHATQAESTYQPVVRTDQLNGKPVVEFGASSENMLTLGSNYIFSTGTGLTFYTVIKPSGSNVDPRPVFQFGFVASRAYGFHAHVQDNGEYYLDLVSPAEFGGGSCRTETYPAPSSGWVIVSGEIVFGTPGTMRLKVNNAVVASKSNVPSNLEKLSSTEISAMSTHQSDGGPFTVGRQSKSTSPSGRYYKGMVAELLVYSTVHDDATSNQIFNDLQSRWLGITGSPTTISPTISPTCTAPSPPPEIPWCWQW